MYRLPVECFCNVAVLLLSENLRNTHLKPQSWQDARHCRVKGNTNKPFGNARLCSVLHFIGVRWYRANFFGSVSACKSGQQEDGLDLYFV